MIYDMCVMTIQGAFGAKEKLKITFPKECEILDIVDVGPVWKTAQHVPHIVARRFKVFYRYDKDNPPDVQLSPFPFGDWLTKIKGGE